MQRLALLLLLLGWPLAAGLLLPAAAGAQDFPRLTGRVVDAADILPPEVEADLTARSEAIEQQTTAQLVVATIPSLDGLEIEDYGYRLGRAWGIGQKDANGGNGVILLVAPNDRKVRIEVGYGLEPILTDALSSVIIRTSIVPAFKAGDMPGGVRAGFDAIARQIELPPDQAAQNVAAAQQRRSGGGGSAGLFFFFLFLALWVILASRRSRGGKRARRGGPIVVWGPGMGSGWGSGGGGWGGGGGFGGGGFSGGGGGFGGGGASGGW